MYTCRLAFVADRSALAASSAVAGDNSVARACSPRPVCDGIPPEGCSRSVCDGIPPENCSCPVGAGEVLRGVGTLASPSFGAMDWATSFGGMDWATQASPPCSTPRPPLRVLSCGAMDWATSFGGTDWATQAPLRVLSSGERAGCDGKGKTFPGLSTLWGSKISFTSRIADSSALLNIKDMYCLFSMPTPCSPLRLPPLLTASSTTSRPAP